MLEDRIAALSLKQRAPLFILLGLIQALCFPPIGLAFLLPICVAAYLLLLTGLEIKWAFRLGLVYGLAWCAADVFWFANIFGTAAISLWVIIAFFPGLFGGLFVWTRKRLPQIPFWLLAAVLWTGVEYYRSEPFVLNFGWLGLSYAAVNDHLLARFASWIGCYGVTFLIALCAGVVAQSLLQGRKGWPTATAAYAVYLVLYLIPLPAPALVHPLRVRLVQAPSEDDEDKYELSQTTPGTPVDIIVWPEYSFDWDPMRQPIMRAQLASIASKNDAYLLFGAKDQFDSQNFKLFRNTAYLLDRSGRLVGTHVKNHTVHFFDDGVRGTASDAIPTDLGRLGIGICFDMDYSDVARRLTQDGAEVLLIPNNDPPNWGRIQRIQHRAMFQMRALECGRWLARADVAGGTSVALPTGVELTRVNTTGPTRLDVTVSRLTDKNLFIRGGWMFGPLCMWASIGLWGWGLVAGARKRTKS
jgi:apolipoprotein N-acyltransferase